MKTVYSKSILASYATFKELYKSQKYNSPYQILSEFIHYVIASKSLYSFTSTDIQGHLKDEFGFDPPLAVIRTALKSITGVVRENQSYKSEKVVFQHKEDFQTVRRQSEEQSSSITDDLVSFANTKNVSVEIKKLSQELIHFLLGEEGEQKYQQIISEYILANKNNAEVTEVLSAICEGGILYSGLAFNISEFGSLRQPITLFLDTEILFDIAGLNGELYKTLADDFIKLVGEANRGGKIVTLKYFDKVRDDIDQFYDRAERIVAGHGEINFREAMKQIVDGCDDVSDVADKKVDFFRKLHIENGIKKDEKSNYYTDSDIKYNLEGINISEYPLNDEANTEGYMFCSHINKLRKGDQSTDYFSAKYLCVTDTRRVLDISKALTEQLKNPSTGEHYNDYAISLSHITNLLWYKLNNGFGSTQFPSNLDVVIKARVLLSSYITQGITATYKDIRNRSKSGELTEEQAAAYIVALKEKVSLPEALDSDNIEDSLDFSAEHFDKFAETLSQNRRLLEERDKMVRRLSDDVSKLENELTEAKKQNDEKQHQIDDLSQKIDAIDQKQKDEAKKKRVFRAKLKLAWSIIWKILVVASVVFAVWYICKLTGADFGTWLSVLIGIIGLASLAVLIWKKDLENYKKNCEEGQE